LEQGGNNISIPADINAIKQIRKYLDLSFAFNIPKTMPHRKLVIMYGIATQAML